jgi:Flp pilus assembly protein TadD
MHQAVAALNEGMSDLTKREAEQAIAHFTQAIQRNPGCKEAYNHRGIAYKTAGYLGCAIADHTEAIRLDPSDFCAYGLRAHVWKQLGAKEKANADFAKEEQLQTILDQSTNKHDSAVAENT